MNTRPTAGEVFHNISRLAAEAEWTDAEIDAALREEGVDPDELVRDVRARLAEAGIVLGAQELLHPGAAPEPSTLDCSICARPLLMGLCPNVNHRRMR